MESAEESNEEASVSTVALQHAIHSAGARHSPAFACGTSNRLLLNSARSFAAASRALKSCSAAMSEKRAALKPAAGAVNGDSLCWNANMSGWLAMKDGPETNLPTIDAAVGAGKRLSSTPQNQDRTQAIQRALPCLLFSFVCSVFACVEVAAPREVSERSAAGHQHRPTHRQCVSFLRACCLYLLLCCLLLL